MQSLSVFDAVTKEMFYYSDYQKTMEWQDDIIAILSEIDGITRQIVLLDTYNITYFVKWVCSHCTIAVFQIH